MDFNIQEQEFSMVLVGEFIPTQYRPSWFKDWNLITDTEAKEADIKIINPHLTNFSLSWVSIKVTKDRLIFSITSLSFFEEFKDMIIGFLRLEYSKSIRAIGLNHHTMLSTSKENIEKLFSSHLLKQLEDNLVNPAIVSIGIKDDLPEESPIRFIKYDIILNNSSSLLIRINNHFQNINNEELMSLEYVEQLIDENWDVCYNRFHSFTKKILN